MYNEKRSCLEHDLPFKIVFLDGLPDCNPPEEKNLHSSLLRLFGVKGDDNINGEEKNRFKRTAHHKGSYKK